ncbi:polysaccharide deacetylase family protein [Mucilaginibacter sp. BJC16-A38]|uniref:polysaccharide deacetylase family protein n=1 Tax=Mucilaginibacter phenanthrenivorans TaxID=1234842 RepID=UPI002157E256|nr:polysaccharide deacetylase family protein [Mucilaginibacter phenanthrenivorans]MCR8559976.1 polysaccharide deacetylase family protein [Mucilaginibacter phenanthrenivorans]
MSLSQKIRLKITRKIKYVFRDVRHGLGFYKNFYQSARGSRILVYHGVCEHDHLKFNTLFITKKTFESHLKFYKERFNVVSLDDYYQQKFSDDKFNICLTFDDGFANNHKYVLPLLEQYQVPATFFVTAIQAAGYDILWNDFLGIISKYGPAKIIFKGESYLKNRHNKYVSTISGVKLAEKLRLYGFDEKVEMMKEFSPLCPIKDYKNDEDHWRQMTTAQIKELSSSPFAIIGAHGYYHNDLAKIGINDAAEELILAKQYLENITEKSVNSIAFPYGSYNDPVIAAAKNAGYKQLLSTDFSNEADKDKTEMRERLTINPFISVNNQMYATVTGNYE